MLRHCYVGVENLALNAAQKADLVAALRSLGPARHDQPACLCHWRTRTDGDAVIFEALFDEDTISIAAIKGYLGAIYGVSPVTIGSTTALVMFATRQSAVVTFKRTVTSYLRCVFFGYAGSDWPTWAQSGDECRAYLKANSLAWDGMGV